MKNTVLFRRYLTPGNVLNFFKFVRFLAELSRQKINVDGADLTTRPLTASLIRPMTQIYETVKQTNVANILKILPIIIKGWEYNIYYTKRVIYLFRRAISVADLTVLNSHQDFIRDRTISADCFRRLLKTYLFARY